MMELTLHAWHAARGARFQTLGPTGTETVAHYGAPRLEHAALRDRAGLLDLSFRSRLALVGADRLAFLHGQVTQDVKALAPGRGAYAALVTAKGRLQSDLNVHCLDGELLLDFEPGYAPAVRTRLEQFVVAEAVQIVDVAPHYGLLSVQGPAAREVVAAWRGAAPVPERPFDSLTWTDPDAGELCLVNLPRFGTDGFDLFAPVGALERLADAWARSGEVCQARWAGWEACEWLRVEAGLPRFGQDMDATNLPPEAGIEARALSTTKGCYIGQEVLARLRTYGQVTKTLRGLRLPDTLESLPQRGDRLVQGERDVGYVTSAVASPTLQANLALAYVRREAFRLGAEVLIRPTAGGAFVPARIVELPFVPTPRRDGSQSGSTPA